MTKKQRIIKKLVLGLIATVICLPVLQHITGLINVKPLKGDIRKADYPGFSLQQWHDGTYAVQTDQYLCDHFGFQPECIRIDNQLSFSFFGETRAKSVLIGKSGYLYEKGYIDAWRGKDFLGKQELSNRVRGLKVIQDSLRGRGKELLVVMAVGKASYYPEFIPDSLYSPTDSNNYQVYRDLLQQADVNHIDFNDWFIKQKPTAAYPLYPKTGTHWSEYGMLLATDSLLNRVNEMFPEKNLGSIYWDDVDYVDERRYVDADIEESLNMYTALPNFKMAYPQLKFDIEGKDSINVIVISDSFFWRMFNIGVMPKVFTEGQFWYYNGVTYPKHFKHDSPVVNLNLDKEIEKVDLIVMMSTDANLKNFPWGARYNLERYFRREYTFDEKAVEEEAINKMIAKMKASDEWLEYLKEKAKEKQLPLDTILRRDAIYMLKQ